MTTYGVRIFSQASRRFLFTAPCVESPVRAGQVASGAFAALIRRDGHGAQDLQLHAFVSDKGKSRPMNRSEEAAMNAAFKDGVASRPDLHRQAA
jgi:hypothetical protein